MQQYRLAQRQIGIITSLVTSEEALTLSRPSYLIAQWNINVHAYAQYAQKVTAGLALLLRASSVSIAIRSWKHAACSDPWRLEAIRRGLSSNYFRVQSQPCHCCSQWRSLQGSLYPKPSQVDLRLSTPNLTQKLRQRRSPLQLSVWKHYCSQHVLCLSTRWVVIEPVLHGLLIRWARLLIREQNERARACRMETCAQTMVHAWDHVFQHQQSPQSRYTSPCDDPPMWFNTLEAMEEWLSQVRSSQRQSMTISMMNLAAGADELTLHPCASIGLEDMVYISDDHGSQLSKTLCLRDRHPIRLSQCTSSSL